LISCLNCFSCVAKKVFSRSTVPIVLIS
jgi:hypothetical protein